MKNIKYLVIIIFETLLRMLPIPSKTGLFKIGNPDAHSPVLLTVNYHLTFIQVKRKLKGLNCYLLVANSRGVNVWCASAGGLFTHHDVISVLKTSGIEDLVDHRKIILPQLAATGVESKIIKKQTGWKVVWGPVYAQDIPAFIANNFEKTQEMRQVHFPWRQRVEMVVAWAFPISFVSMILIAPFWTDMILPLALLVWILSFLIFISFPLYSQWLRPNKKRIGFVFFDFGRGGFQLILWGLFIIFLFTYATFSSEGMSWSDLLRWGFVSFVVVLVLSMDLSGSTPTFKSGLHEENRLQVEVDKSKCKGVGFCEDVCPRNCFEVDHQQHTASMPREEFCVQCGACIVQCPFDALHFSSTEGNIIPPETIRKFKLNLLGTRFKKVS